VIVLTRYFVENDDRDIIDAVRIDATHLSIRARDNRPALLLETSPTSAGATDRYGRRIEAEYVVRGNSQVLLIEPDRVRDVGGEAAHRHGPPD
jgi:hypothetical protein